jgi:hypothetical protein
MVLIRPDPDFGLTQEACERTSSELKAAIPEIGQFTGVCMPIERIVEVAFPMAGACGRQVRYQREPQQGTPLQGAVGIEFILPSLAGLWVDGFAQPDDLSALALDASLELDA